MPGTTTVAASTQTNHAVRRLPGTRVVLTVGNAMPCQRTGDEKLNMLHINKAINKYIPVCAIYLHRLYGLSLIHI